MLNKHDFGTAAVIVARVSTPQQLDSPQIEDLVNYAKELGFNKTKVFGTTESGFLAYDDKIGWNLVVDFFEKNPEYRTLICTELSRLSRLKSTLMLIEEYLTEHKIQLIVKDINFFLYNDFGQITASTEILFSLYASFASSEMSNKKERFKRALREYRLKGYSIGGKRLFGYNRVSAKIEGRNKPLNTYVINEKEKEEIIAIYKWYAFGIDNNIHKTSVRTITQKCIEEGFSEYLHSERNVAKCLKEQAYTGLKTTHNKMKNPEYWNYRQLDKPKYIEAGSYMCLYPTIFEGDNAYLFEYVQKRLHENNSRVGGVEVLKERKHTSIMSKLLRCPQCGRYLHGEYRIKEGLQRFSYRCAQSRASIKKCDFTSTLSMKVIDSVIWGYCKSEVRRMRLSEAKNQKKINSKDIQKKILNIQAKIDDFDWRMETAEGKFGMEMKRAKSKSKDERDEIIKKYHKKIDELIKEKEKFEINQAELRKQLLDIEESNKITKQTLREIDEKIYTKEEISKYIHLVVKSVEILHNSISHTVLKIKTTMHDIEPYICIYKKPSMNFEAIALYKINYKPEYITGDDIYDIRWDSDKKEFTQGTSRHLTLHDVYDFALKRKTDIDMSIWTMQIICDRLDCYENDSH